MATSSKSKSMLFNFKGTWGGADRINCDLNVKRVSVGAVESPRLGSLPATKRPILVCISILDDEVYKSPLLVDWPTQK